MYAVVYPSHRFLPVSNWLNIRVHITVYHNINIPTLPHDHYLGNKLEVEKKLSVFNYQRFDIKIYRNLV